MIKWIITIAIVYFVYKYYIKPMALQQGEERRRTQIRNPEPKDDGEGEFIDYEEVDD